MNALMKFMLWAGGILGAIGVILYIAFFDIWTVPSDDPQFNVSIEPQLTPGDRVLISRHGTPAFGNLVRCADPDAPGRYVIGRVVGVGGDAIEFASEVVFVNGARTPSPRACEVPKVTLLNPATQAEETLFCGQEEVAGFNYGALRLTDHPESTKSVKVDPNKIYLASDNRHMHQDSRDFGPVDPATCLHIVFRLWGTSGFGDSKHRFTIIW